MSDKKVGFESQVSSLKEICRDTMNRVQKSKGQRIKQDRFPFPREWQIIILENKKCK